MQRGHKAMSDLFPTFFKWSDCKSKDEKKPDTIDLKVTELETWESEFSININAEIRFQTDDFIEKSISLKSHDTRNSSLLVLWNKAVSMKRIAIGDTIAVQTWLGKSKKSDYEIRRWRLIRND